MMLEINNIIRDLYKYKNEEFNTKYLKKVINYFKKKTDKFIFEIENNEFELSGIYIHLLYNNYKFIFSNNLNNYESYSYRKINLNYKQLNNLLNQKYGLDKNDFKLCSKIDITENNNDFYIIIIDSDEKYDYISKELALILLGIESLYFLNHQNLDNYCSDIIINNSIELFDNLKKFKKILEKLTYLERHRIILFGGLIYQFLGTIYTKDIDINIFCKDNEQKEKYIEYFKNTDFDILYLVQNEKNNLFKPIHEWLYYKLPQIRNIDNIYTILINPNYHFYFMGIKCIDILTNFQSSTNRRANSVSINDTILLKKINNINFYNIFCIKNFRCRSKDKPRIFTNYIINNMYNNIVNIIKKWWNIDINIEYLKNHFNKCDLLFKNIDYTNYKYCNKYTNKILKFLNYFIETNIFNYIKKKSIFEIEFNRMPFYKLYYKAKIKYLYGIDSSIYNINYIQKKLNKYNFKYYITDGLFTENNIYLQTLQKKNIDVILLLFSIQSIYNHELFINNIRNISKSGTIIIITYLNGNKIYNELKKNNKIEIFYKNKLFFGIYPFNDDKLNKVLFYQRDIIKYELGVEENLVFTEEILNLFSDFKLIKKQLFLENNTFKLLPFQKEIISYYELLILQKN
jgi:hypothetical protein